MIPITHSTLNTRLVSSYSYTAIDTIIKRRIVISVMVVYVVNNSGSLSVNWLQRSK